jgi:hypothetical protein
MSIAQMLSFPAFLPDKVIVSSPLGTYDSLLMFTALDMIGQPASITGKSPPANRNGSMDHNHARRHFTSLVGLLKMVVLVVPVVD